MDHQAPRQQDRSIRSPPSCGASIGSGHGEGSSGGAADAFTAIVSAPTDAVATAAASTAAVASTAAAPSTAAATASTAAATASTAAAAVASTAAAPAVSTAAAAVSTAAAALADPAIAATASAAPNVDAIASAPTASALLTSSVTVGIAATTPADAATAAPNVAATSAGDRGPVHDLYSAAFTLRKLSRSQWAHGVPKLEHTNYATEVGGDGSNRDTTLRDEGHGEQQEGIGSDVAENGLAVGDDGHRRRHNHHGHHAHHRHGVYGLSRSRSMSPSRGEKIDGRQRGAVNSRGASSLVARASHNVVRSSAARASAADAARNDCHAPAVDKAPIVAAGASPAAGDDSDLRKCDPRKCASPQDGGIGPSATGARERLAGVPQQAIRRDLGRIFDKNGGTDFEHARSEGAIFADIATASGAAPAFRRSPGKNTMKAGALPGSLDRYPSDYTTMATFDASTITPTENVITTAMATKNFKIVVKRQLSNATSLKRLYVPVDMASTFMPPLPSLRFCKKGIKEVRNCQRGGEGQAGGRVAGKGAGSAGSKAAAAPSFSRMTVSFAVTAEAGPLLFDNDISAPVVDNDSSGPVVNNESSGPVSANNTSSSPAGAAVDDDDLGQPTERGDEKLATSMMLYDVEYERRHFGDQVHHRLTKGWHTLCLVLEAGVGDTLEMARYRSRGDQDLEDDYHRQNNEETGVDHGDEDAGTAAGSSSVIFVRVVN
jgi:hypothetical protein